MTLRATLFAAVVSSLLATAVAASGLSDRADCAWLDACIRARPVSGFDPAILLLVASDDDRSSLGPWPWSRRLHGDALKLLARGQARCAGLDLQFDAPSPATIDDDSLALALRTTVPAVLAVDMDLHGIPTDEALPAAVSRWTVPAPVGRDRVPSAERVVLPVAALADTAAALGFTTMPDPDPDGVVRYAFLLLEHRGRLYPSLPLAVHLLAVGRRLEEVRLLDEGVEIPSSGGSFVVPLDDRGRFRIDFRPRPDVLPVVDYGGLVHASEDGPALRRLVERRSVLVGSVQTAAGDLHPTPISPLRQGVLIHAEILDQLTRARALRELPAALGTSLVAALALLGAFVGSRRRLAVRLFVGLVVLGFPAVAAALALRAQRVLAPTTPTVSAVAGLLLGAAFEARARTRAAAAVDRVFRRFLSPAARHTLLASRDGATALPARGDAVMLVGRFDGLDEARLSPEEETQLLRELLGRIGPVLHEADATILRLDAEGVLALFGRPVPVSSAADLALRAAISVQRETRRVNAEWIGRTGTPLHATLALHAGTVTAGALGSEYHEEYTVFGAEVRRARELLAVPGVDRVVASARFVEALRAPPAGLELVERTSRGDDVFELVGSG